MKIKRALKFLLPVLLVAFVFTNCDMKDSSVGTFDDVADKLPNFTVMEGAEQVTVRVRRNNDRSYFDVNLSKLGKGATILDGDYLGWCAHWSAPIDTRGEAYDNITLYSTRNDKNWNKLNYLLNNRSRFYNEIDGAGYKEIQAVIWTLIEFKEFDIDRNRIFDDLNRAAFDAILDDVREHGDSFEHTPLTTHAIFADMSVHVSSGDNTQTVIVEGTSTAYGGDTIGDSGQGAWFNIFDSKNCSPDFDQNDQEACSTQGVYAGKTRLKIGTVAVVPGPIVQDVQKCLVNFEFDEYFGVQLSEDEPVKIEIYAVDEVPTSRPASGPFTAYKGLLIDDIEIDCAPFYIIHLDALYAGPAPLPDEFDD